MEHKLAQAEKKLNDLERYLSKPSKYKGKEFLLIQYAQERITELEQQLADAERRIKQWNDGHNSLSARYLTTKLIKQDKLLDESGILLEIANCPNCDGSGAYYDNMGEVCQCQWCYEKDLVLTKLRERKQ